MRRGLFSVVFALLALAANVAVAGPVVRNECASPPVGTVFCEDFENPSWRSVHGWNGIAINDTSRVTDFVNAGPSQESGNRVLQLNIPGGIRSGAALYTAFTPTNRVWARWYTKYNAGFYFSDNNHGTGLDGGDTDLVFNSGQRPDGARGQVSFWSDFRKGKLFTYSYYHGMYQDCSNPNGGCFGDALPCVYDQDNQTYYCEKPWDRPAGGLAAVPTATTERWYCVEQYVDLGDPISDAAAAAGKANGEFRSYIDGKLIGQVTNMHMRTSSTFPAISELLVQLFFHDTTHNTAGQMFDNFVVATQRIGCGTTTPKITTPVLSYSGPKGTVSSPFSIQLTSDRACSVRYSTAIRPFTYTAQQTQFSNTGSTTHTTSMALPSSTQTYYFQCADDVGNLSNMLAIDLASGGAAQRTPNPPTSFRVE